MILRLLFFQNFQEVFAVVFKVHISFFEIFEMFFYYQNPCINLKWVKNKKDLLILQILLFAYCLLLFTL